MKTEKSCTPISDSMNRWMQPRAYSHPMVPPPASMGTHTYPPASMGTPTYPPGAIGMGIQQAPHSAPAVPTLNPITPRMKSKKRIRKNVTVLKEDTSETMFVNYTVEEKRTKVPAAAAPPRTLESHIPGHSDTTQRQQIVVPAHRPQQIPHYADSNDASHEFFQRVITPTGRFHRGGDLSASLPSSPALATPLPSGPMATSRPASAVRPAFPQRASYGGGSPYTKRPPNTTPHKKHAVYKRGSASGAGSGSGSAPGNGNGNSASLSTTALSTTLESAELDSLPLSLSMDMPEFTPASSYLDHGHADLTDPFDAFFGGGGAATLGAAPHMELGDSDTTAFSLPADLFPEGSLSFGMDQDQGSAVLDMGLLLGLQGAQGPHSALDGTFASVGGGDVADRSLRKSPTPSPPASASRHSRTVTGSTVTAHSAVGELAREERAGEAFPLGNNTPTDKLQFGSGSGGRGTPGSADNDDIFNILK
ncbi:hypothetical protein DAKH74_021760 [Maudiozyma humilis]|uniref:Uncharacterized protein n=1 Tax=Maudiozyma humilis TaxID=51915 RepID=A0AAV5RVU7_MAUHU|nr:hypothetical protein DAKH74_021760 [Kazachstania humilis]